MLLHRRLYFILSDVNSARWMRDEMLLARIGRRHIQFLARRGLLPGHLREASVPQKTGLMRDTQFGVLVGAAMGCIGGLLAAFYVPGGLSFHLMIVLIGGVAGSTLGAWFSSMAASAVPNRKVEAFHHDIEQGRVLMMIDVPVWRICDVSRLVATRYPEAVAGGIEPTIPAFP